MLADAFAKSLKNLLLPGIIKLFLLCLVAYFIGWSLLAGVLTVALQYLMPAQESGGWFVSMLGGVGGVVIAWFTFPLLYPVLMSFFDESMAEVIERQDYPQLPKATPPFWPTLWHDTVFSLKALGLNLLLLPFYLIPFVGIALYYLLNGWLLGSQFFRMAAGRRVGREKAEEMRKSATLPILFGGALMVFFATIPVLNLVAPLLGVATMLHLFHAMQGSGKVELLT